MAGRGGSPEALAERWNPGGLGRPVRGEVWHDHLPPQEGTGPTAPDAASDLVAFRQIWIALPHEATLKFGEGLGGGAAASKRVLRIVFEIEF